MCWGTLARARPRLVNCRVPDAGSGAFAGGLIKGLTPPTSVQRRRGVQEDVLGTLTGARPRLAKCRDRDVGSGAFACGFSKCLT